MNKRFWKFAANRAIRTVSQTAVATIGTTAVLEDVNWLTVISASLLAGILSMLTSISTGLPENDRYIEYREVDGNGVPTDGHYVTVISGEEE